MNLDKSWPLIRRVFGQSFRSSLHYALATVGEDGGPHVTPIGSLILDRPGHGFYFEEFPRQLPQNLKGNRQVCVLAVNSSRWFWIKALFLGRFAEPPAVRLYGRAGDLREASEAELALWHRRILALRASRGYALIWRNMRMVRDIEFTSIEPVLIGEMTRQVWGRMSPPETSAG
jgi:hypothetical protein